MPPDFSALDHLLLSPPLHAIPIRDRPSICVTRRILRPTLFYTFFLSSCLLIHLIQLLLLPLYLLPFSRRAYHRGIAWTKDGFGSLLIAVVQLFGPSSFVVTVDESLVMEEMVRRDGGGRVVGLRMAERSLFVANHQQYADWVYIWILFTLSSIGTGICIILKASLRWPPVLGPAMQLFRFAFVSKEKPLQKSGIYETAKDNFESGLPFSLLLFPEGTLLSPLTRPKSAAFAKASGVPDLKNLLTPRSTGLLHCLRTLSSLSPDLLLYDATIGYPGVPSGGHAQQFYTLHSTFGLGTPPPSVHIHLRVLPLAAIPLGARTVKATPEQLEEELSVDERLEFQEWTRRRWEEKDELLGEFGERGEFPEGGQGRVHMEVRMRRQDWLRLASFPLVLGCVLLTGLTWRKGR